MNAWPMKKLSNDLNSMIYRVFTVNTAPSQDTFEVVL